MGGTCGLALCAPLWRRTEPAKRMMTGIVTARREAILRLTVLDVSGEEHVYDSVVDTGYNGTLTFPPNVIAGLGLRWHRAGRAVLADGSESEFSGYKGVVLWDGRPMNIRIDEVDADSLVGMSLMYGYELDLPVIDGATFTLRSIATPQPEATGSPYEHNPFDYFGAAPGKLGWQDFGVGWRIPSLNMQEVASTLTEFSTIEGLVALGATDLLPMYHLLTTANENRSNAVL